MALNSNYPGGITRYLRMCCERVPVALMFRLIGVRASVDGSQMKIVRHAFVAAVLALALIGCGGSSTVSGSQAAAAAIGSEVRDGKFAFVVNHVETGKPVAGDPSNEYLQSKAKGEFVIVHLKVTNIGDKAQGFFVANQKLIAGGKTFEADAMASLSASQGDINPGLSTNVSIAFDVPVGTVPDAIELHDSMLSGGAKVNLK